MSVFQTKCSWLPCRKSLGVTVWRLSKFSTQQFCCKECAEKWLQMDERNKNGAAQEYRRLLVRYPSLV